MTMKDKTEIHTNKNHFIHRIQIRFFNFYRSLYTSQGHTQCMDMILITLPQAHQKHTRFPLPMPIFLYFQETEKSKREVKTHSYNQLSHCYCICENILRYHYTDIISSHPQCYKIFLVYF